MTTPMPWLIRLFSLQCTLAATIRPIGGESFVTWSRHKSGSLWVHPRACGETDGRSRCQLARPGPSPRDSASGPDTAGWRISQSIGGVGAVGSAAVYTLAHFDDIHGLIHLIDNDTVDESNLNRYALMRRQDIGCWKSEVASEALSRTSIKTASYRDAFSTYADEHGDEVNLLLSPVDSEEGRRALAKTLPRRVINAATSGTTVTLSTHGFGNGKAYLHCLYLTEMDRPSREEVIAKDMGLTLETVQELLRSNRPMDADIVAYIERSRGVDPGTWADHVGLPVDSFYVRAVCGDANVHLPSGNVMAPLSFISASAGVLLAAELVKIGDPHLSGWALDNYFRIDTLHMPQLEFLMLRADDSTGRCICRDPDYIEAYAAKYGCPMP